VTLSDGSRILLDADSALGIAISGHERRIRLLRGAAFFQVTHIGTPFVVEAANGEARVLGTEFDVSLKEDRAVTVTLARGSVEVGIIGNGRDVILKPGESVDYGSAGLSPVKQTVVEDEMAWHDGRFIFNNARLSDVLAQIERYRDGRIVILRSKLSDLRVSGNIGLDDTDKALAAVQSSVGFRLTSLGRLTVIGP
jgi:transmembrane sensor